MRKRGTLGAALFVALVASAMAQSNTTLPRRSVLGAAATDDGGVRITSVRPGGAADRARLHVGDIVTAVRGQTVQTAAEFASVVKTSPSGRPIPFAIRRGAAALTVSVVLDRPPDEQDPAVETFYGAVSVDGSLRRTLVTIPRAGTGPRPALLVVGGIGCYSVDNAAEPQDAYMRLTHDLGKRGVVAMRLEKSGVGDSQGPPCLSIDLVDEMHSYEVALAALVHDPRVAAGKVYVFGHSIGSLIAPRIALPGVAAGVIVAEGVGRNWFEYELWNLRRQLELGGISPAEIDTALAAKETCMHRLLVEKAAEDVIERDLPECRVHNAYPAPAAYMQQAAALNVAEAWTRFRLPLLAIYGTADFVTTEADHRRIVDIVNDAHPGAAAYVRVPGMDHHLDVADTPQQAYDRRVKRHEDGEYDEHLTAVVLEWLCRRETCLPPA
jgi:pimeloyl-ACP methyl ester carboxylesterase